MMSRIRVFWARLTNFFILPPIDNVVDIREYLPKPRDCEFLGEVTPRLVLIDCRKQGKEVKTQV